MADSCDAGTLAGNVLRQIDNTYCRSAEEHDVELVFKASKVKEVIRGLLNERLKDQTYDPVTGTKTAKALAADLRDRVKALGFSRHKTIVQVSLSQQTGQTFKSVSRCLWDNDSDATVSACFQNESLICEGQVHGLYYE